MSFVTMRDTVIVRRYVDEIHEEWSEGGEGADCG